jgi:UDP-glucose:(heptosyl)LPS alpha-1,3-glucosyltransferase
VDPQLFDASLYPSARAELRQALSLPDDAMVALLMGTSARKGLETAVAAVARASPTLHLVVAGSGDTDMAQRWARASGLERRLHLVGPRGDPERLFAACDVFVLPTRYEPFGMVIMEAMASSVPVVVSATSGAAEHIQHGVNGYLVDAPDDVEGFAEGIRLAIESGNRHAIGRAARLTALTLTWPRICEQTEDVYDEAKDAKGAKGVKDAK